MKITIRLLLLGLLVPGVFFTAQAQELEEFISAYTGDNGSGYAQPLGDALEGSFNSGFFHSAKIPGMGFSLDIGFTTMLAFTPNDSKTFLATPEGGFTPANPNDIPVEAPTIFGQTQAVQVAGEGGTAYTFPGGIDLDALPLAVPQLKIGAIYGTDLTFRYFAADLGEELGSLNLFGIGLRHSVSQYLPDLFPVDIALAYYYQSFSIDNFSDTNTSYIGAQGSFKKGPLIVYSGLGYGTGNTDISYTYDDNNVEEEINIELESSNNFRILLGAALKLGPFYINTDYNVGAISVWNTGLGFSIGQ